MQGKVEICGVNTAHLKTLKNDEMVELLRRSQAGDQAARERLIEGNLRLVLSVIQRFSECCRDIALGRSAFRNFSIVCPGFPLDICEKVLYISLKVRALHGSLGIGPLVPSI